MRTVTFQSVLWGAARLLGMDPARDMNSALALRLAEHINRAVAKAWRFERWPEWTLTEPRTFRLGYVPTQAYAAGDEVYFPPADKYYQALTAGTGNAPASVQTDGTYPVNAAFWAECAISYAGNDFVAGAFIVGDVVKNPADGQFYQLINQNVRVTGAGTMFCNGDYEESGSVNGRNSYVKQGASWIIWSGTQWIIRILGGHGPQTQYSSNEDVATPDLVITWQTESGLLPLPVVNNGVTNTLANTNCWARLTPFSRYIAYSQAGQTVIWEAPNPCAFKRDPRVFPRKPWPISTGRGSDGITFAPDAPNQVWLQFWPPPPVFSSQVYVPTEANLPAGAVRYFPATGECYTALQAQNPAAQPPTNAAFWQKLDFPFVLASHVTRMAQADVLREQKQNSRALAEQDMAEAELADEADKATAGQGIYEQATVVMS